MSKYYHFNKIDSTSTYLKSNYHKYDNLTFVSADFQEQGHGRYNRKWVSNKGENLLFSILIKDKKLIEKFSSLSLLSAYCIVEILEQLNIKNVSIKWPNDVFVNDKKIAGILLESISYGGDIEALVIGAGINVNSKIFNDEMINTPTSIYLETGENINITSFKEKVYERFNEMLEDILLQDINYIEIINNRYNYLKGKNVYARVNNSTSMVKVICINEDNSLKVESNNKIIDLYSGEISFHM